MTQASLGFTLLDKMIADGNLIRGEWTKGRHRACLLAALVPACGEKRSSSVCPDYAMWPWLAEITPWINDNGTLEAWPRQVRRYADAIRKIDFTRDGRACLQRVQRAIMTEAKKHDRSGACDTMIALIDECAADNDPRWAAVASWGSPRLTASWAVMKYADAAWNKMWDATAGGKREAAQAALAARLAAGDRIIDGILTAIETEGTL